MEAGRAGICLPSYKVDTKCLKKTKKQNKTYDAKSHSSEIKDTHQEVL